jgi:ABC-type transporter Mla maintaining outer membrane lipid asymmetry permease subunit MlaE
MIITKKLKMFYKHVVGIGKNHKYCLHDRIFHTDFLEVAYYSKAALKSVGDFKTDVYAGVKTFIVVSIVALFTGMILALQIGLELKPYQQQSLVGISLLQHLPEKWHHL